MAKLKIERGTGEGNSFFINDEATVGTDAAQVTIKLSDPKVSRTHARIFRKGNSYYIEDLESKNGTFVNGRPIAGPETIEGGDYIRVGFTWLSFGEDFELEKIRKELSAYEVLEEITQLGGAGLCFKVKQLGLDRIVTLNLLPPSIVRSNPKVAQKFRQQARDLAQLSHENIAIMLDFEATASFLYLTTEYVEGETLFSLLTRKKRLPLVKALEIGIGIARGLSYAHSLNILHQDVNPRNVLLSGNRVILGGFGVAAVLSEAQEQFSGLVSKTEYLSPEQISQGKIDHRSDIYSLGVVLYELFAGKPPFGGETTEEIIEAHLNNTPEALTAYNPEVPGEIEHVIYQCLEKDPEPRPKTCEEIADKMETILLRHKITALRETPNIYTLPLAHYVMQLLCQPLFIWAFFPLLSVILLLVLAMFLKKGAA